MKKIQIIVGVIVLIAGIVLGILKFQQLPERVEKVEHKSVENEEAVEKVAHTFDLYMMEQRTIQAEQDKREKLMLEIIKKEN